MDKLVYLPIEQLHPHPRNPRKELGDLTELADSIKANGVFQNLTVIPGHWMTPEEWQTASAEYKENPTEELRVLMNRKWLDTEYTVIIGHRRCAASKQAGLSTLPCAIVEMTEQEQLQTMLLENMQRSDLTVYEQAQGFQLMIEMGDTPEGIAEKTGFSKTTVKRRLKMAELDQRVLKEVSSRQISLGDFDKLSQIEDVQQRNALLESIGTQNFNMAMERALKKQNIQKQLPWIKKLLRAASANKLKQSEVWGSKYARLSEQYKIYELQEDTFTLPTPEKGKLFYTMDEDYGSLQFYQQAKKAEPVKRSKEEIQREKEQGEANRELEQLSETAWKLRRSFVEGLVLNSRNRDAMFTGALSALFVATVIYSYGTDWLYKAFGCENKYSDESKLALYKKLGENSDELIPKLIYAAFCDEHRDRYHTTYAKQWPRHKQSIRLDMLYNWLCSVGYEMSDEEKQLWDGTHPLLHLGESHGQ